MINDYDILYQKLMLMHLKGLFHWVSLINDNSNYKRITFYLIL